MVFNAQAYNRLMMGRYEENAVSGLAGVDEERAGVYEEKVELET